MTHQRFCDAFVIARDVIEQLANTGSLAFPVPVKDGIIPVASQRLSLDGVTFKIISIRKDWRSDQFYSVLFRYAETAEIVYSSEHNRCWKRFAVSKELAHLLIDDEKTHFTIDVVGLIQRLITDAPFFEADGLIESEFMGVIIAMELLMPWKLRGQLTSMRDSGRSDKEIAEFARVPEKFVNVMLRSPYGETSKNFNEQLDGNPAT